MDCLTFLLKNPMFWGRVVVPVSVLGDSCSLFLSIGSGCLSEASLESGLFLSLINLDLVLFLPGGVLT